MSIKPKTKRPTDPEAKWFQQRWWLSYFGSTSAFRHFREKFVNTIELLSAGLVGADEYTRHFEEFLDRLALVKGIPGPVPKSYEPEFTARTMEDGTTGLIMQGRTAHDVRVLIEYKLKRTKRVRFHLYAVLTVYVWGLLETYTTMLLEELYEKHPDLLKSSETLSVRDVIEHRNHIHKFVIAVQLQKVGHFSLKDLEKYFEDRLNLRLPSALSKELHQLYLVRNIVAHNTGVVREDQVAQLPEDIKVQDGEIFITMRFLNRILSRVSRAVITIERHVQKKGL